MNYMEIYNQWLESDYFDADTKKNLKILREMKKKRRQILHRFRIWYCGA